METRLTTLPDQEGFIEIRMEALFIDTDIYVQDVSFLERSGVRDPMTDHFIHTCADTFRELVVVQGRRVGIIIYNELVGQSVYLVSSHSYLHLSMSEV